MEGSRCTSEVQSHGRLWQHHGGSRSLKVARPPSRVKVLRVQDHQRGSRSWKAVAASGRVKATGDCKNPAVASSASGSGERAVAGSLVVVSVWSRWWRACLHLGPGHAPQPARGGASASRSSPPPHGCPAGLRLLLPGSAAARCVAQCPEQTFAAPLSPAGESSGGGGAGADACRPCHYSCVACAGPAAADCTRCHGDAEPRPSARGQGRVSCWPRAAEGSDRAQWWLLAGAVSLSASVALLLALAACWCAQRRRLTAPAAPAAPGRLHAASRGRSAAYFYRRVGADDEDEDDEYVRGKDAAVTLSSSESESGDSEEDAASPRPVKVSANGIASC